MARTFDEAIRLKPDYANAFAGRGNAKKLVGDDSATCASSKPNLGGFARWRTLPHDMFRCSHSGPS